MTPIELSYLAGLFDGEGCFSAFTAWGRDKKVMRWRIFYKAALTMSEEAAVKWAFKTLKMGRFYTYHLEKNKALGHKPRFMWHLNGPQGAALARMLLPYLRVKKKQAALLVELSEIRAQSVAGNRGTGPRVPFRRARQLQICEQIRKLNRGKGSWRIAPVGPVAGGKLSKTLP